MLTIAYLTSANVLPSDDGRRPDYMEGEIQFSALNEPCRAQGLALSRVVWDAPGLDWTAYDAVLVGTTWDYWDKLDAFTAMIDGAAASGRPVFNAPRTLKWNLDKGYLADLASRGAPSVPTVFADRADAATLEAAFERLGTDEIVVKPRVGAGAWRQARIRREAPIPAAEELPPAACLIQPFLASVPAWGEVSFLMYDGVFSHAVLKAPARGDYRVQSLYGARESVYTPDADELARVDAVWRACADAVGERPLYARVDMVRGDDGGLVVMEVEMIEPYHYPEQGPDCGVPFAAALKARLG